MPLRAVYDDYGESDPLKKGKALRTIQSALYFILSVCRNYLPLFSVIGAGDHCEPVITVIIENLDLIRLNSFVFRHDV